MKPDTKIILDAEPFLTENFSFSAISTDISVKMPFSGVIFNFDSGLSQIPKVGDLFEVNDKGLWELKTPYLVHTYELATVLGKRRNDLLVYGNKIGETIIKNYNFSPINNGNATFDIQRGDELLLSEYVRAKFAVLRNITQERIKHRASK